jgi:putative intracellular protease/amidase
MLDLADSKKVRQLLEAFYNKNKPIGATSHGIACLLPLQNNKGESLMKGKQLTGISNSEENSSQSKDVTPFLLETELLSLGALYSKGENYVSHVVEDGNIITGQNPASSKGVAQKIIELVKHNKFIDNLLQPVSG